MLRKGANESERGTLRALDAQLLLPLAYKERLEGLIVLGPKLSEEPYAASDVRLLKSVATQTGMALENSRLTEAVASEVAQRERATREMEIAKEVQERLFPQCCPNIPGLGLCWPLPSRAGHWRRLLRLAGTAGWRIRYRYWRSLRQRCARCAADGQLAGIVSRTHPRGSFGSRRSHGEAQLADV
jgi:hypothetical protein